MSYTLKPPAGIDPTTDWDMYAANLTSDADTDKKRTAAAVAGTVLLTKNILDNNLIKKTASKMSEIETERTVTDSLINKRFEERNSYKEKIEGYGGKVNVSINDEGDAVFNIDDKEKVKDSLRREEIDLAGQNLPLKGYSNDRQISKESRKEAIRKADLRYDKLVNKQQLYDWNMRTKEEAQAAVEPLFTMANLSLNKARHRDIIAKKFTELTGSYVENPHDAYLEEARKSIEKIYNLRDTEYSKLVSEADKKSQQESDKEVELILKTLEEAKNNPDVSDETKDKIDAKISLLEDPPEVQSLSPTIDQINNFVAAAGNGLYGKDAMDDPAKAAAKYRTNFEFQSLVANGNHDNASLHLASLPVQEDPDIINFLNPSERVKLLTQRDVDLFLEVEKEKPTYSNALAQAEHVKFNTRRLQNVTIGTSLSTGGLSYTQKTVDAKDRAAHDTKMFGILKNEILEKLIELDKIKITPENRKSIAGQKLSLEYEISNLAEKYKDVNKGDAYNKFYTLFNTHKEELRQLQAGTYDGRLSSNTLENNYGLIERTLTNIVNTAKNSSDPDRAKIAQGFLDSKHIESIDTIARILTLADLTAAYGSSGNVSAQWYRREGIMVEDLFYDIAVDLDRSYAVPNITEKEKED